jgi:hypothetical protein
VLYDPDDHSKVVIDHSDEATRMLMVKRVKEKGDARVRRMRDRGKNFWADRVQAAQDSVADYIGEDQSNLSADEREDALVGQQQKTRAIMAGDSAERGEQIRAVQLDASIPPDEKQAKIMELMAGLGVPAATMLGGQPATGAPSSAASTADALSKLADLHTDEGAVPRRRPARKSGRIPLPPGPRRREEHGSWLG